MTSATFRELYPQLALFPLHTIEGTHCGCGRVGCDRVGKHPAALWRHLGTAQKWRHANADAVNYGFGIATGKRSGIFVVDCDGAEAAESFFDRGPIPNTFTVGRGEGHLHFYFRQPTFEVKTSAGELAKNVDVRGAGGFVVCPGSPHRSGDFYRVVDDSPVAEAPAWLLKWKGLRRHVLKPASTVAAIDIERTVSNVPRAWRVARARTWLATRPTAIQRQGGDRLTWKTLLTAVKAFCLTDVAMVEEAFAEWNARCIPPWEGSQWFYNMERAIESDRVPWDQTLGLSYDLETTFSKKLA